MVEHYSTDPGAVDVGAVFHALADGHRRTMLEALERQPRSVGELAAPLPISLAAASKHVQVLERAGLVRKTPQGRRHVCSLETEPLRAAHAWIARYGRFWSDRIDRLGLALATEAADRAEAPAEAADRPSGSTGAEGTDHEHDT